MSYPIKIRIVELNFQQKATGTYVMMRHVLPDEDKLNLRVLEYTSRDVTNFKKVPYGKDPEQHSSHGPFMALLSQVIQDPQSSPWLSTLYSSMTSMI